MQAGRTAESTGAGVELEVYLFSPSSIASTLASYFSMASTHADDAITHAEAGQTGNQGSHTRSLDLFWHFRGESLPMYARSIDDDSRRAACQARTIKVKIKCKIKCAKLLFKRSLIF